MSYKKIICSDCLTKEVKVDSSSIEVICSQCLTIRIALLRELGQELFIKIFYTMPKQEGKKLLEIILKQLKDKAINGFELKKARNQKGLSQLSLSSFLGVSKTSVVKMENNRKPLNYKAIELIQRVNSR